MRETLDRTPTITQPEADLDVGIGDTVCLKSGGHLMTVVALNNAEVDCSWSIKGDCKSKSFPRAAIKRHGGAPDKITISFVGGLPDEEVFRLIKGLRDALNQADISTTGVNQRLVQVASDFLEKHDVSSKEIATR